jgi:hypothetical protein
MRTMIDFRLSESANEQLPMIEADCRIVESHPTAVVRQPQVAKGRYAPFTCGGTLRDTGDDPRVDIG